MYILFILFRDFINVEVRLMTILGLIVTLIVLYLCHYLGITKDHIMEFLELPLYEIKIGDFLVIVLFYLLLQLRLK